MLRQSLEVAEDQGLLLAVQHKPKLDLEWFDRHHHYLK